MIRRPQDSERGVIMVLGMFLVIAMFLMASIIIDVVKIQYVGRTLQRSIDAASLAGTVQLNATGNPQVRWKKALRAVLFALSLDENRIFGFTTNFDPTEKGCSANDFDCYLEALESESLAPLPGDTVGGKINITVANAGGLTLALEIERGVYGLVEDPKFNTPTDVSDFTFCSLEGKPDTSDPSEAINKLRLYWPDSGTECYMGANAMRIKATFTGNRGWFGQMLAMFGQSGPEIAIARKTVSAPLLTKGGGTIPPYLPWARVDATSKNCITDLNTCWHQDEATCPDISACMVP